MDTMKFELTLSKKGIPCLWESGGGMTNTGSSQIIADPNGAKKRAIYIKRSGSLACRQHALVPVAKGDVVIKAYHHRGDFEIRVYRLDNIVDAEAEAVLEYEFSDGEWNKDIPESLKDAVRAAMKKATDYHCRTPYYVIEPESSPV